MKKLVAMSMIACMAMATVACGSSNSGDTAAAETTESTETADAAEDAEAADTADTSDKTWVIAMDTVFRPFEFTDENNEFVGIDVDIIKAVAEDQGFKIDIQSLGWDAAVAAVQSRPGRWSDRRSKISLMSVKQTDGSSPILTMIPARSSQ